MTSPDKGAVERRGFAPFKRIEVGIYDPETGETEVVTERGAFEIAQDDAGEEVQKFSSLDDRVMWSAGASWMSNRWHAAILNDAGRDAARAVIEWAENTSDPPRCRWCWSTPNNVHETGCVIGRLRAAVEGR